MGRAGPSSVLFVCTGNIFRSMTAAYGLRAALGPERNIEVGSAGLQTPEHDVMPFVRTHLLARGLDVSGHRARPLTRAMLARAGLAIAMDFAHRRVVEERFGTRLPLFSEVAYDREEPMPDVQEAVPNWQEDFPAAVAYGTEVMDYILDGIPGFVTRMDSYFRSK